MGHKFLIFITVLMAVYGGQAMAIEEAKYSVVQQDGKFETRDYEPYLLAEVEVDGAFEEAGNKAFRYLFKYISGTNQPQAEIAMTAPVSQVSRGEDISMTAPVSQTRSGGKYVVSFMMPAQYTLETIPIPTDPAVSIRQVPAQRMAVVRYSGRWNKVNYEKNKKALESWISEQELEVIGEPVWARYNAPFSLWFLRRNEILIPVAVK
jgi:hypothetical protein